MSALVTGGSGFLGLYVTEQLRARGEQVRVFCRKRHPRVDEIGAEWIPGDIRDRDAVSRACEGVDVVFHTAAHPGVWGPWSLYRAVNTDGTLNVIDACRRQGVGRLVHTSSASVVYDTTRHENVNESRPYANRFLCHYPRSKALAEKAVLDANAQDGLTTVALRPHLIWGPRDNHLIPQLVYRARVGRLRRVGNGRNLISTSYVENAAAAHLAAADELVPDSPAAGQAYFINEPEPLNLWQWVDELIASAGLPPIRRKISSKAAWQLGALLEGLYRLLRLPGEPVMTRFVASQLSESHYYDISKARRDFGYEPRISIEEGMRRLEPDLKRLSQTAC